MKKREKVKGIVMDLLDGNRTAAEGTRPDDYIYPEPYGSWTVDNLMSAGMPDDKTWMINIPDPEAAELITEEAGGRSLVTKRGDPHWTLHRTILLWKQAMTKILTSLMELYQPRRQQQPRRRQ